MNSARRWADALRAEMAAQADPARASAMQAYMKSTLPFLGIPAPRMATLMAQAVQQRPIADTAELIAVMQELWRHASHREERYAALNLPLRGAAQRKLITIELLPLVQEMIVGGAWWDFVDHLSGNLLPALLKKHPQTLKPLLRRWARGDGLWLRRAAMLCQRKCRGEDFDAALFYDCIRPSIGPHAPFADEFFIRKGIGWALRERSYAAPQEVEAFCREHDAELSPLTRREALRAINRAPR